MTQAPSEVSGQPPGLPWRAPDYATHCLTQVLPSAVAMLERRPSVLPMPQADRVVVLLVDGLGLHPGPTPRSAPFLSRLEPVVPGGIDAAFPSTTASSVTSLGTGLPPGRHGIVGASFWLPEIDNVLFPLGWKDRPSARSVQPEPTVFEAAAASRIAVTVVQQRAFANTGLTLSALRGGVFVGADSPGELVIAVAAAAAASPPALVYGYFSSVDKSGHVHGGQSEQRDLDLWHVDRAIEQIAERLPRGTLLLVTGDHGMVDCAEQDRIDIDRPALLWGVRRIAGEPRMRQVYLEPRTSVDEVVDRWSDYLGPRAVVLTRNAAIEAGLFGEVRHDVAGRIGDVLVLPTQTYSLVSKVDTIVSGLLGQHGGLTEAERRVPLLGWTA